METYRIPLHQIPARLWRVHHGGDTLYHEAYGFIAADLNTRILEDNQELINAVNQAMQSDEKPSHPRLFVSLFDNEDDAIRWAIHYEHSSKRPGSTMIMEIDGGELENIVVIKASSFLNESTDINIRNMAHSTYLCTGRVPGAAIISAKNLNDHIDSKRSPVYTPDSSASCACTSCPSKSTAQSEMLSELKQLTVAVSSLTEMMAAVCIAEREWIILQD